MSKMRVRYDYELHDGKQFIIERRGSGLYRHGPFTSFGEAIKFVQDNQRKDKPLKTTALKSRLSKEGTSNAQ